MENEKLSKKRQEQDIPSSSVVLDDPHITAMEAIVMAGGGIDKGLGPPDINELQEVQLDRERRAKIDKIAIDSNILSYFVDVTLPDYDPINDHETLRNEKISTLRIALYARDVHLYILPLVEIEWKRISDSQRRFLHSVGKLVVFSSRPWKIDQTKLNQLISNLLKNHPKEQDCQLLAEAELSGMKIILTNDNGFITKLSGKTSVTILRPSEYFKKLNIKIGTPPIRRPDKSNPLIHKTWWVI
jgi:hypothetical protein